MARQGSESVGVAAGAEVAAAGADQATSADAPGATGFADYLHSHRYQRLSGQMRWWEFALELGVAGACSAGAAAAVAAFLVERSQAESSFWTLAHSCSAARWGS